MESKSQQFRSSTGDAPSPDLQQIVRRVVAKIAAERIVKNANPAAPAPVASATAARTIVDAAAIAELADQSTLEVQGDAIVTPMAADMARERNIKIQFVAGDDRMLTIAIGADHGGYLLKAALATWLRASGHRVLDFGTGDAAPCDYPDFALAVARAVASGAARFGIMIDGAGIGSSMAANRVRGVLAALCNDPDAARNAREHNFANMLTMGARKTTDAQAREIVAAFLTTPEGEERHARRVRKIRDLDRIR